MALALVLAAAVSACAYYNAMYNANRWAAQAERSERAGRLAEARERWQRAALHAESLLARHRDSRWADDALLVRGRALVRLERWSDAVVVLREAAAAAQTEPQRIRAWLEAGRAYFGLRMHEAALAVLDSALARGLPERRGELLLWRGRARLWLGDPAGARSDFRLAGRGPEVLTGELRAALALSDTALAGALADSLAGARRVSEADVLPLLDTLALASGPDRASRVALALAGRRDLDRGVRARAALADGDRLARRGFHALARERYQLVMQLAPDSAEARLAAVRHTALDLREARGDSARHSARARLAALEQLGGAASREAATLLDILQRADTLSRGGDAAAFLGAELLRDSLGSPGLAAVAFARMAEEHSGSPWAPKALLGAIVSGHPDADSLRALLAQRYPSSPYTSLALGLDADQEVYAVLEDSLRAAIAPLVAPTVPVRQLPGERIRPTNQPRPGARPRVEP